MHSGWPILFHDTKPKILPAEDNMIETISLYDNISLSIMEGVSGTSETFACSCSRPQTFINLKVKTI
jgi:hypothetical protein